MGKNLMAIGYSLTDLPVLVNSGVVSGLFLKDNLLRREPPIRDYQSGIHELLFVPREKGSKIFLLNPKLQSSIHLFLFQTRLKRPLTFAVSPLQ